MKPKIIVMFSGSGTVMNYILDHIKHTDCADILNCITDIPTAGGISIAAKHDIPCLIIEQAKYESRIEYCSNLLYTVKHFNPDFIILSGFMKILSPEFVNEFPNKIINIHPSLLPKYPGLHTHQRVIDQGDSRHGFTIHFVDAGMDTGPIIFQGVVELDTSNPLNATALGNYIRSHEQYWYPKILENVFQDYNLIFQKHITMDVTGQRII